jgi:tetratricopeptide (TPR) repeat protein
MASIFIYNRARGKCVELNSPQIVEEDINELKSALPANLEGISFSPPIDSFETTLKEMFVEDRENKVAEYLKNIGRKLEQLHQAGGAIRFYDLAFRLSKNSEVLMMKARVLSQYGQADQAQKLLHHFVEQHPESPEAFFMFGRLALSRADYADAHQNFQAAKNRIRQNNVEHRGLLEVLNVYERFVRIYLDRDLLFNRDLSPEALADEIQRLRNRTQALMQDIQDDSKSELQGMQFFLETQDRIFEKWLAEMSANP